MAQSDGRAALSFFGLDPGEAQLHRIEATHPALHVISPVGEFALRQYNPFTSPQHLTAQFRLGDILQDSPVKTPAAVRTLEGRTFAKVNGALWALFPWHPGRTGQHGNVDDYRRVSTVAGLWVQGVQQVAQSSFWPMIENAASLYRQRKSFAWVVPLDRVAQFAREIGALGRVRYDVSEAPEMLFREVFDEIDSCLTEFTTIVDKRGIADLPRCVTHGDLFAENLLIDSNETTVIDLDCFSYEPRASDLARAVCRLGGGDEELLLCELLPLFQETAALTCEEVDAIPALMAGYHLYYAVVHGLLLPSLLDEQHSETVKRILIETAMFPKAIENLAC